MKGVQRIIRLTRLKLSGKTSLAFWSNLGPEWMPFADAASPGLPLSRLLRLSLFQVTVGMAIVLLNGTLNRVMIVELSVPAWLVGLMISLPMLFAPFRALIGFRSDHYRSFLGWRRVPFIWMGTLLQFGGLAIMPFALLILSGDTHGPLWIGHVGAALAFLLVGAGLHTAQTSGLALATDLAEPENRPRVVALLYVMLLLGMLCSALLFGYLLEEFSQIRLIGVIQGAALLTMVLNLIALWKQEPANLEQTAPDRPRPSFSAEWRDYRRAGRAGRLLIAIGLGTAGFGMQDVLLEPYGAQVLSLSVSDTTILTAILSAGTLAALFFASRRLTKRVLPLSPVRLWRADRYRRVCAGDVLGSAGIRRGVPGWHRPDRFRRRLFCCRHPYRRYGLCATRGRRTGARRLGRSAGDGSRFGDCRWCRTARPGNKAGGKRHVWPGRNRPAGRLHCGLPVGNRIALCHAGSHRAAG